MPTKRKLPRLENTLNLPTDNEKSSAQLIKQTTSRKQRELFSLFLERRSDFKPVMFGGKK